MSSRSAVTYGATHANEHGGSCVNDADGENDNGANVVAAQKVAIRAVEAAMVNTQQH